MSNDDVTITRTDARTCRRALDHYAAMLEKAKRRDQLGTIAMAIEAAADARRNIDDQLAAPSPVPSAPHLDERLVAMSGESHRYGGPVVESKARGPRLDDDEKPLHEGES